MRNAKLQRLQVQVRRLEATMAQLLKFKAEVDILDMYLSEVELRFPEAPDNTGGFYAQTEIETLEKLAARLGVRMEPPIEGPVGHRDLYFEQPMAIEVEGRRHSVRAFIEGAMTTPTSLLLTQVQFESHGSRLWARLDIRVHRMKPEDGPVPLGIPRRDERAGGTEHAPPGPR